MTGEGEWPINRVAAKGEAVDVDHRESSEAQASRRLARYLPGWCSPGSHGCKTKGSHGGLTEITFRYADRDGRERRLTLRAVLREGVAVIEVRESDAPDGLSRGDGV